MEKYSYLSLTTQRELLQDFAQALLSLRSEKDAVKFLIDLLTKEEVIKLAKRIKIAQLLLEGKEYRVISESLRVSHGTIAKIAAWLQEGGEGFKLAFSGLQKKKRASLTPESSFDLALKEWKQFKRRYPTMFWPSLLIEGIVNSANRKQREKMFESLKQLDRKSKIYKDISRLFNR